MFCCFNAVVWSFLSLRQKHAFETDQNKLKPVVLIAVGILVCIVFIVALIGVVKMLYPISSKFWSLRKEDRRETFPNSLSKRCSKIIRT